MFGFKVAECAHRYEVAPNGKCRRSSPSKRRKGTIVPGRLSELFSLAAEQVDRSIVWWRLPTLLGIPVLVGLRDRLRALNLYDTGRGPKDRPPDKDPRAGNLTARTLNGTYNDLVDPLMGSQGSRFGRNIPLTHTLPEDRRQLEEDPNPREVSRLLLTRGKGGFQPATTLNLLAAAWIQFEVHDWFSHGTLAQKDNPWKIKVEDDEWPKRSMRISRTVPDPSADPAGEPTYVTQDTHWWDGSQIYGRNKHFANGLRRGERKGKIRIDELGLPPKDLDFCLDFPGPAGNFWLGLAILHSLFMREHNAICERLAAEYPSMSDDDLYDKARLVNIALIAKIHTIDWTPAIIAHPTTIYGMRANWFGVLGEGFRRRFGRITSSEILQGIPGSRTDHFGVPYSLTEEFVAVYRMHPLIPDDFTFRSATDNTELARYALRDLLLGHVRERLREFDGKKGKKGKIQDIFYSFGRSYPGALNLHNFPIHLQEFTQHMDGPLVDLATIDIVRTRERGVPRYNEFRRLLRLKPASSFEDLTDNPQWAQELRDVYGDVERVDLMIGLYAEPKPPGFGFSDTAFRIFMLMASRRLNSDRFFTSDFRAEIYTQAGMDWIADNNMRTVLLRHFPALEPALCGVKNPFGPWARVTGKSKPIDYSADLERQRWDEEFWIGWIVKVLGWNNRSAYRKYKHGIRDAHAKSHGILQGKLIVEDGLDEELRQGLFAEPKKEFDVIARLSSTSGALRSDELRGVRGLGIKVLDVPGDRVADTGLPGEPDATTQDFVLVTHRSFPFADVRAYATKGMLAAWLLARLPDRWLGVVGDVLDALKMVGIRLSPTLALLVLPNNHILGEKFYSSAPLRYGKHVVKMRYMPSSPAVKALMDVPLPRDAGPDAHRDSVVQFFDSNRAVYELQVQLCTNTQTMPIEDASVEWPECVSPYRTVAKIVFESQSADSPERREFGDDVLSFNSWRTLVAHRPLGSINRLKKRVYEESSKFRHEKNNVEQQEPADITALPGYSSD
jgi:hypothetical protein